MKKLLLFVLNISSLLLFSQVTINPIATHYNNPYPVTLSGNGTIYYTTDGSMPTLSSNSAINNVQITINQNKEIKAFLVDGQGNSSTVVSKKYYTGILPTATIYFKPNWTTGSCIMIDMVNPNAINGFAIDTFWPGITMTNTGCEGWYKANGNFENANVMFNNCSLFPNIPQSISTNLIPMGSVIYYDFSNGEISTPPACLFLNTQDGKAINTTMVKIYPNPVSDVLKINSGKDFKDYEIIDGSGNVILKKQLLSKEISISHLVSGNYFLRLNDQQGYTILLKFIKK